MDPQYLQNKIYPAPSERQSFFPAKSYDLGSVGGARVPFTYPQQVRFSRYSCYIFKTHGLLLLLHKQFL